MLSLNNKARTETEPVGAEENAKRCQMTNKLYAKNEVDLTFHECVILKARVAAIYDSPLIVGRIGDVLEGRKAEMPAADDGTTQSRERRPDHATGASRTEPGAAPHAVRVEQPG